MYILAYYTDAVCNLPTHTHEPYSSVGILNSEALAKKKRTLTEIVNGLFNGKHNEIFGVATEDRHIIHGHPKFIYFTPNYPLKFPPSYDEVPSSYPGLFPATGDRPLRVELQKNSCG